MMALNVNIGIGPMMALNVNIGIGPMMVLNVNIGIRPDDGFKCKYRYQAR